MSSSSDLSQRFEQFSCSHTLIRFLENAREFLIVLKKAQHFLLSTIRLTTLSSWFLSAT